MRSILLEQAARYPCMQPQDAVKLLYQRAFGCGHLIEDLAAATAFAAREMAAVPEDGGALPSESIGGGLCRLSLRAPQVRALGAEALARMMAHTAARHEADPARFARELDELTALTRVSLLPFSAEALDDYLRAYRAQGMPPARHSEAYRAAYAPAYRVVDARYGLLLPLLTDATAHHRANGRALLALDGMSAAGKSTLAALLAPVWNANVFHMDDFFLPPALRTPERLAEPGGNVDYERFLREVLGPLEAGVPFAYRRYDCHADAFVEARVEPTAVTLLEGSYALHPAFWACYERLHPVTAYLRVDEETQRRRILRRNGERMLGRFEREWLPLEKTYASAYDIARRADYALEVDAWDA